MGIETSASDWQVVSIYQLAGATAIGGGIFVFIFLSEKAKVQAEFVLAAAGLGLGGNASGVSVPSSEDLFKGKLSYSPVECQQNFSANDLDGSFGRLTTFGVTGGKQMGLGVGITYISASTRRGSLFASVPCHGIAYGTSGAIGLATIGVWRMGRHSYVYEYKPSVCAAPLWDIVDINGDPLHRVCTEPKPMPRAVPLQE